MAATVASPESDTLKTTPKLLEANVPSRNDYDTEEVAVDERTALRRGLRSRHTAMIGIILPYAVGNS